MRCEEYESSIVAYVLGELAADEAADCRAHIEACAHCRSVCESYTCVVGVIAEKHELCPTASESEALSRALAQVDPVRQQAKAAPRPIPRGLPALIWGSLLAFVVIATVLALQTLGRYDFAAAIWAIGPARIVLAAVITVFVTSFLPIAVAARRRPLNGMTFRR
jgi:anti-sigma factor RsiW